MLNWIIGSFLEMSPHPPTRPPGALWVLPMMSVSTLKGSFVCALGVKKREVIMLHAV